MVDRLKYRVIYGLSTAIGLAIYSYTNISS